MDLHVLEVKMWQYPLDTVARTHGGATKKEKETHSVFFSWKFIRIYMKF